MWPSSMWLVSPIVPSVKSIVEGSEEAELVVSSVESVSCKKSERKNRRKKKRMRERDLQQHTIWPVVVACGIVPSNSVIAVVDPPVWAMARFTWSLLAVVVAAVSR